MAACFSTTATLTMPWRGGGERGRGMAWDDRHDATDRAKAGQGRTPPTVHTHTPIIFQHSTAQHSTAQHNMHSMHSMRHFTRTCVQHPLQLVPQPRHIRGPPHHNRLTVTAAARSPTSGCRWLSPTGSGPARLQAVARHRLAFGDACWQSARGVQGWRRQQAAAAGRRGGGSAAGPFLFQAHPPTLKAGLNAATTHVLGASPSGSTTSSSHSTTSSYSTSGHLISRSKMLGRDCALRRGAAVAGVLARGARRAAVRLAAVDAAGTSHAAPVPAPREPRPPAIRRRTRQPRPHTCMPPGAARALAYRGPTHLVANVQQVPEALRHHQRRALALALQQGVGGHLGGWVGGVGWGVCVGGGGWGGGGGGGRVCGVGGGGGGGAGGGGRWRHVAHQTGTRAGPRGRRFGRAEWFLAARTGHASALPTCHAGSPHRGQQLPADGTAQHGTAQHSTAQHSTARHGTAQHIASLTAQHRHSTDPPWCPMRMAATREVSSGAPRGCGAHPSPPRATRLMPSRGASG